MSTIKRLILSCILFAAAASGMVAAALYLPSSLPTDSDFGAIYNAALAFRHGVPIYDFPAVSALAARDFGVPVEKFFLIPFLYPPWYVLFAFYLAFLPMRAAAVLWFEINLMMFFLSVWLLTAGWNRRARPFAFFLALIFPPVLGGLSVGQYGFPVLLGGSLLFYALRRERAALAALGMILLTFKPHLGALIFLSALAWLFHQKTGFTRRALKLIFGALAVIFFSGFIADPKWMLDYPATLFGNQNTHNVEACARLCANLPFAVSHWLFDGYLAAAAAIGIFILVLCAALLFPLRPVLLKSPVLMIAAAALISLLASPYLFNYDFILLLLPFAALLGQTQKNVYKIAVLACYTMPLPAFLLLGRGGNFFLILASILAACVFYLYLKSTSAQS